MIEIVLQNPNRYPEARASSVRPFLERLVEVLRERGIAPPSSVGMSLGVRFVSDREMQRLSKSYRQIDRPTDVLSFPGDLTADQGSAAHDAELAHWGDVVIAVPYARRQAEERGHRAARELETLLLHGVLHCLGYDHETDNGEMDHQEAILRREFGLPVEKVRERT